MQGNMARDQTRKWMIFVACIWIQAFTGTNFDFSSYSSDLKAALRISQVELNYLSMASDMGKAFGWCSGVCLLYLPVWAVLLIAAFMGLVGYGLQWLLVQGFISLHYFLVFLLSLVAGSSISWFNTVAYVLCIKNFPQSRSLALSLSISFSGVSAALYNLIVNAIASSDSTLYLLLNGLVPLMISLVALILILGQPPPQVLSLADVQLDSVIFHLISVLAASMGIYLLVVDSTSFAASLSSVFLVAAAFFLVLPLVIAGTLCGWQWAQETESSCIPLKQISFNMVSTDDSEVHKNLMEVEGLSTSSQFKGNSHDPKEKDQCCEASLILIDRLPMLEEEHSVGMLVKRWDFWLYYIAYLCGGTFGIVYSNNLGQIAQSLGFGSEISSLVSLYSAFSFFGRLLSAAPDFLQNKVYYPRTEWLALALVPTPIAFLSLVSSGSKTALSTATALIGLSSGYMFSAAVSVTSELFGPNSAGINHNILVTNIPLGSFLYGLLAALLYEANIENSNLVVLVDGSKVCLGRQCYVETFVWWSLISLVGVVSSFLLFLRTRLAYDRLGR